ncbi:PIG-L family deacetylase [Gordonia sp. VNK21]|uniref:PIG-L family deacetylase n=1 Tax=Gordonia sp. VNK21 TaxID=3382483 RepID=UPI0038D380C4
MFIHAHPDDESLWTGGTIASVAARGGDTSLIMCTWAPGTHRHRELLEATAQMGMTRPPIMLGYADSHVPDSAPGAARLVDVPFDEQVHLIAGHIRQLQPEVIVTYDAFGIYGHIDHIHTNRLACAAADAAGVALYQPELGPPWQVPSLYFATLPQSTVDALTPHLTAEAHIPVSGTPDTAVDLRLDVGPVVGRKIRAIRSHATELKRSASMRQFGSLPPEQQRLFLRTEAYLRRDLVPGGAELGPA